ncbi:bifunctional phosphoribosyl-AMP cyclohydrolase/phosphoribosyl-ATP diphosphatase HisIE [Truepera radiovictrix]|uniref:Histidine biosynthesis bifunctional protein HisIE n=1 Tax=Truepera radiovictrix (strain DSM 17093 / CIP 108686 / LMG 22925 / RQ-24) TaxID=649638 RepID=D7CUB7_TRURR|nr:bifunctional phosphoribosyl-AMP cyclohydrolase/phosphoribosyl-ATP diphosphatase HisIE [Truepera radiovictrix]ADI15702.1 phosphoribosyl-ATP diphosphatase [Truepera radiovictrix DSM 17093]WMT58670.1 bifunctional phosphoribosyl-AMP cyclohydrolase/phosphoribosyl-ATP diphosphatase HisIE [Truepera radiovictrix]
MDRTPVDPPLRPEALRFDERGLVPVVTQDAHTAQVLMLAYANREAVAKTLETGEAHYYSRSRGELWRKGATSGHVQRVVEVRVDCDADALLYRVVQTGAACHTGARSCFYRALTARAEPGIGEMMATLEDVVAARLAELPEGSYVTKLHARGLGYVAQKVVEEAGESVVAALTEARGELAGEAADLLFHLTVLLHESGSSLHDVAAVLAARHGAPHKGQG